MIAWILQNWGTVTVAAVLAAGLALAIRKTVRDRKTKGCGGGCSGCGMSDVCHKR